MIKTLVKFAVAALAIGASLALAAWMPVSAGDALGLSQEYLPDQIVSPVKAQPARIDAAGLPKIDPDTLDPKETRWMVYG